MNTRHLAVVLFVASNASCMSSFDNTARYFGEVRWDGSSLGMHPPIRDRHGNVYLAMREGRGLGQSCGLPEAYGQVFVGRTSGGFSKGCTTQKNARPVHGWVGFGEEDAFIWSGDALVRVADQGESCTRLFNTEPTRRDEVNMTAVIPWLWDRPAMRTMLALIWVAGDRLPYHAVLDVDRHVYTEHRLFSPFTATDVVALGAAGNLETRTGAMLLAYEDGNERHIVALFLDERGHETARTEIPELAAQIPPPDGWQDAVAGMPAMTSQGMVAVMLVTGQLLVATPEYSYITTVEDMAAQGVQLWNDRLWIVGTTESGPAVAEILPDGARTAMRQWQHSLDIDSALQAPMEVVDERIEPRRILTWSGTQSALGSFPLVASHSMSPYDAGTAGWIVAGPSYDNGSHRCRSIAFMPLPVGYP